MAKEEKPCVAGPGSPATPTAVSPRRLWVYTHTELAVVDPVADICHLTSFEVLLKRRLTFTPSILKYGTSCWLSSPFVVENQSQLLNVCCVKSFCCDYWSEGPDSRWPSSCRYTVVTGETRTHKWHSRGGRIHVTCRSVCDRDQESWSV